MFLAHHKIGLLKGHFYAFFGFFLSVKVKNGDIWGGGGDKISNIFRVLDIPDISFFGGGGRGEQ